MQTSAREHLTLGAAPQTGCDLVLECTISAAAVARGFTSYFAVLFGLGSDAFRIPCAGLMLDIPALLIVAAETGLLCYGIRESSNFNIIVNIINLLCILFVLIVGTTQIDSTNYQPFLPFGSSGIFAGASIVFFSFIGFDTVATAAEETIRPERDLPIGIIGSLGVCTVLYVLMSAVITGMVRKCPRLSYALCHVPTGRSFKHVALSSSGSHQPSGAILPD